MKSRKTTIPVFLYLLFFALCLAGLVLGSFFDLSINNAISSVNGDNPYGAFFETIGVIPAYLTIGLAGAMIGLGILGIAKRQEKKGLRIFFDALGVAIFLITLVAGTLFLGGQLAAGDPYDRYGFRLPNKILAYAIGFVLEALMYVFAFFCLDRKQSDKLLKIGAIIAIGIFMQWLTLHFLKQFDGRPRFRFLYGEDNGIFEGIKYTYQEWFQFSPSNPHMEYFKSWPSGHSASIVITLGFAYIPLVSKWRFKHDNLVVFLIALAYSLNMFFARIIAGAHYLSDVAAGALIGTLYVFLSSFIIEKFLPYKETPPKEEETAVNP